MGVNYSPPLVSLRDYSPFSERWQVEFKLKWNVISLKMICSVPAVPTFRFMGRLYHEAVRMIKLPARRSEKAYYT